MENDEKFEELYNKLYNENIRELENLRMPHAISSKAMLITLLLSIVGSWINMYVGAVLFAIFLLGLFIYDKKERIGKDSGTIYINKFKEKIITPMIQEILPNSTYYNNGGMDEECYSSGNWEKFDMYKSDDEIVSKIKLSEYQNTEVETLISEVHTKVETRDSDGYTTYNTAFCGLVGYIKLPKNIEGYIKVVKNASKAVNEVNNKLEMDMSEFEKMFDVETDDKIKAMQLLTADVMAELINLTSTSDVKFEFYINNDIMHIRFHTGPMFEPDTFGKSIQYNLLKSYFNTLVNVKKITEYVCNSIMSVEI